MSLFVESPSSPPSWNMSKFPVVVLMLELTPGMFAAFKAVLTFDNAVPPVCTVIPLIFMLWPFVTVVPEATDTIGSDKCHALDPNCTQVFDSVFLYILFVTCVVLIA